VPQGRPPRLATAHRTRRELLADRDRVSAVGAVELTFHMIPGGGQLGVIDAGGDGRTFAGGAHSNPSIGNT